MERFPALRWASLFVWYSFQHARHSRSLHVQHLCHLSLSYLSTWHAEQWASVAYTCVVGLNTHGSPVLLTRLSPVSSVNLVFFWLSIAGASGVPSVIFRSGPGCLAWPICTPMCASHFCTQVGVVARWASFGSERCRAYLLALLAQPLADTSRVGLGQASVHTALGLMVSGPSMTEEGTRNA